MDCLERLLLEIEELENNWRFYEETIALKGLFYKFLRWEGLDGRQRNRIDSYSKTTPRSEAIENALMVTAWGSFEEFYRGLIIQAASRISELVEEPHDIPLSIREQNSICTGSALIEASRTGNRYALKPDILVRNLNGMFENKKRTFLNGEALAVIKESLTAARLEEKLIRVGYTLNWKDIGDDDGLKTRFSTTSKTAAGDDTKKLIDWIVKKRNEIAHTGGSQATLAPNNIGDILGFIKDFAASLYSRVMAYSEELPRISQRR